MTNVFQAPEGPKTVKTQPVVLNTTGVQDDDALVDLNQVIQASLNLVEDQLNKQKAIIRCDSLPHIYASPRDVQALCDNLMCLILHHPPRKSKLFIYIKCNRTENEILPVSKLLGLDSFDVCFHTNSCNEATWQMTHQKKINECSAVCARNSGSFVVGYGHADCLFKFTLPGKLY